MPPDRDCRVIFKNLRDWTGTVHAAKSPWTTKCGRRFVVSGYPVGGVVPTWDAVTCGECRATQKAEAA